MEMAEERINKLEVKATKIVQFEQQRAKRFLKNEESLVVLWPIRERSNMEFLGGSVS